MAHSIALNFEDGVTRFIAFGPDETIADASYRAGIKRSTAAMASAAHASAASKPASATGAATSRTR